MIRVDVKPDTPEWLDLRRGHVMASDVAAVLGLSPYATALDVWHTKRGADHEIPEMLAWVGHRMEPVIADWLRRFHPELGQIRKGFMAVSEEWPWLGATVDRVQHSTGRPIELKTANRHSMKHWFNEAGDIVVPVAYQVQVQTQLAVTGEDLAYLAVALAGSDFELIEIPRDDAFITEHLVPRTREFWGLVETGTPPPPANLAEQAVVWPTRKGTEREASELERETAERWAVLISDSKALKEEADAVQKALGEAMGDTETLMADGAPLVRLRTQQGRRTVSVKALDQKYPELVDELVTQGAPFKVMTWARKDKK